ncbi:MAG: CapA family protein [Lachnospiraceae bacterium]|nr:CapA family protein [Lachnospiraceae bacterium]
MIPGTPAGMSARAAGEDTAAEETETAEDPCVRIIMVGDMLMHKFVVDSGLREDGSYNFDHLFTYTADRIRGADIAIVNQETILGGASLGFTGYPTFNSPFELGDALTEAGFDIVLQGTNHALDRSARGIENCLDFWKNAHPEIAVLGIHDSAEDQGKMCFAEAHGMRIAILNYTYGTNGLQTPAGKPYLVDYMVRDRVLADLARAEEEADFTIVCPHWGTEYELAESAYQRKWMRLFMENGADLVIGTHPHVIEPVRWESDDAGHQMLVYYSLGNYVNSTATWKAGVMNRMVGGMAQVDLERDADGRVRIRDYAALPLVEHIEGDTVSVCSLWDYSEEQAAVSRVKKQDPGFSVAACRRLIGRVWPGLYEKSMRVYGQEKGADDEG